MILELVKAQDLGLRQNLPKFDFLNPPTDPIQLARDLAETMIAKNGIGLAANQVGLPHRVFVMKSNPILACFNPLIIDFSEEQNLLEEGCLTYPNFFIKVKRSSIIKVRYTEPNGNIETKKFIGMTARIFQHELDHLNGVIFTQKCSRLSLELAIKKANKLGMNYTIKDFI
jgi:peptide deformylase